MEKVKSTNEYTVLKKRSGRYAVKNLKSKMINGEEKTKILLKEGLIKLTEPSQKEEAGESTAE